MPSSDPPDRSTGRPLPADPDPEPAASPVLGVADGVEQHLDQNWIVAERIGGAIVSGCILGGMLVALVIVTFAASFPRAVVLIILAAWSSFAVFLAVLSLWWPAVRYRHIVYQVTDRMVRIRRGVLWRSVESVPRSRVQHTDVSQGPVERAFGLATLIIYTAGTQHASISLAGLHRDQANLIRDHLITVGQDDAV